MYVLFLFSDRIDVSECMNHKWLAEDVLADERTQIVNPTSVIAECVKTDDNEETDDDEVSDEDKENSVNNSDKHPLTINQNSPSMGSKLILEKSLSISLFPDAPTTPKVCRKTLYDDEDDLNTQVKEIVKKYQTNESYAPACCNKDKDTSNECLLCHPKSSSNKPPSLEIDKGIIC